MTWTAADVVRLPPRAEARAAAAVSDGHSTSAMVALLPDGDTSWCLQTLPHVTLVYAGQVDDAAPGTRERLEQACAELALTHAPMIVPVTGVDTFGREERVDVLTLAVDRLAPLRAAVEWANASEFTEFKPHATVGPEGSAASIDVPATLTFSRLMLSWGHDDVTWFLVGGQTRSRPLNPFAPMAPELRSRLFREYRVKGKGGQFADGGGRVPGQSHQTAVLNGPVEMTPAQFAAGRGEFEARQAWVSEDGTLLAVYSHESYMGLNESNGYVALTAGHTRIALAYEGTFVESTGRLSADQVSTVRQIHLQNAKTFVDDGAYGNHPGLEVEIAGQFRSTNSTSPAEITRLLSGDWLDDPGARGVSAGFREFRVAGKGGQFAKGGGRIPGMDVAGAGAYSGGGGARTADSVHAELEALETRAYGLGGQFGALGTEIGATEALQLSENTVALPSPPSGGGRAIMIS